MIAAADFIGPAVAVRALSAKLQESKSDESKSGERMSPT
jgi:hypothetical protein